MKGGDASSYGYIALIILLLCVLGAMLLLYFQSPKSQPPPKKDTDKVCLTTAEFERLKKTRQPTPPAPTARDYRVLQDPLYPPLNRTDTVTQTMLQQNIDNRNMYVPTNDTQDNYRLVGYLVGKNTDAGGGNWKLFARQKDRNTSDFYMIPSNNNYDIKIYIKDEMVVGDRLRDVYTIPKQITFNSPMLDATGSYEFVEIPKADLSSSSRYL